MMYMYALLLLCTVPVAFSYSGGPPVAAQANLCTDMIPTGHNNGVSLAADQLSPPYTITTSTNVYAPRSSLMVTITGSGSNYIRGFFIQARRTDPSLDNDVAIGTFSSAPANTQLLMCHDVADSAWGHSATGTDRSTVIATWNAPAQTEGPLQFMATIVLGVPSRSYFYLNVTSDQISFSSEAPSVSDGTTQSSTPSSGSVKIVPFALVAMCIMLASVFAEEGN